ncbi:MMPL family transporter [Streptomyces olivoreticuli]
MTWRWPVLVFALVAVALSAAAARGVQDRLIDGGYVDPAAESSRAARMLERQYGAGPAELVLVVDSPNSTLDGAAAPAGRRMADRLAAEPGVTFVRSPWAPGGQRLLSADRHTALLLVGVAGGDTQASRTAGRLIRGYSGERPPLRTGATGRLAVNRYAEEHSHRDLVRSEMIGVPAVAVVLLLVFGSSAVCVLPLAMGLISITGAAAVLDVLARHVQVSVFALNLVTALGFGLAVDYSLIVVSRFREELDEGLSVDEALRRTVRSAGRTIAVSAGAVALSLSALLFFPAPFFRSLGAASLAVVLLAALTALSVQPVLLALLGHRVRSRSRTERGERGFWARLAEGVLRRPLTVVLCVAPLLLLLAAPFTAARCGFIDEHWLPEGSGPRVVAEEVRERFPAMAGSTMTVLLPRVRWDSPQAGRAGRALSGLPGAALVAGPAGGRDATGTWYEVATRAAPYSATAQRLVRSVRDRRGLGPVMVAGETAALVDMKHTLAVRLGWAAAAVAVAVGGLLFLLTGSVVVPLKAVVMNLLSLAVSFGAMVLLFQDGLLSRLLGGTATGHVDPMMPVVVFCVAFGVSMDYEVFLVARIHEEYLRTGDNDRAVAVGLRRTGRAVTAAALTVVVALGSLVASELAVLQLIGATLALSVAVDATLIRCLLVPAVMGLAGRWNWWAPAPLRALRGSGSAVGGSGVRGRRSRRC